MCNTKSIFGLSSVHGSYQCIPNFIRENLHLRECYLLNDYISPWIKLRLPWNMWKLMVCGVLLEWNFKTFPTFCFFMDWFKVILWSVSQFSSVIQSYPTLCDPMNRSMPGLHVHHQLPEFTQTHVHQVSDAIQPSRPLSFPSPPAPNPSQHQGLFQWVSFLHQVAKVLEFQLQHQSFQWTPRTDLL